MHRSQRAVLIGGFALTVAVGLSNAWLLSAREEDLRGALAAAVGTSLPFEARLSGGFLPPSTQTVRAGDASASTLSPDARIAIAQLEKRAAADPTPRALAGLGVAYLVQGDIDRAIGALHGAAAQQKDASVWSDLAAAYLAKADRAPARRIEYLSRALEAAAQSLRISPSNEAQFNRSLALDKLAPFAGNANPWADYLAREPDARWLDAANAHAAHNVPRVDARQEWEIRQRTLRQALVTLDKAPVVQTVRLFPEASLEFFGQLLVEWAQARVTGRNDAATSLVAQARLLADAIHAATGDRLPVEEAAILPTARRALAAARLDYAEGLRRYGVDDYDGATRFLTHARGGFAQSKSPYLLWVDVHLGTILSRQRNLATADERLTVVETLARARHYDTLLGRALWERGLVQMKDWRLMQALGAFREAASCFERTGEHEHALAIYSLLAALLRSLGEEHESWQQIGKTLEHVNSLRSPTRRYVVLYNATLFAARHQLLEAAFLFQDAAVREATGGTVDGAVVDAITQRAAIHLRRGDRESAARDLESAIERVKQVPDGPTKNFLAAEMDIVAAQLRQPGGISSLDRLRRAIAFFERTEPARVPSLYLQLARLQLADGPRDVAEETLRSGIDALERQQSGIGDEALKISYFDDSWDLFQELIASQVVGRNDQERAFEYAERSRARLLLERARDAGQEPMRTLADVQRNLPASVTLVYYVTLPDRLIIWAFTSTSSRLVERRIASSDLARLVAEYRAAILERRSTAAGAQLHDALIAPVAEALPRDGTVVFAPDADLQQLPFAALRNPATHRYVIEDYAVVITPSAGIFAAGRRRARELSRGYPASALLVGNPETIAARRLPGAETEVFEAAQFYPEHEILTGASATKDRFIKAAPEFDVVHFGGHGLVNTEYPLLSRLVFASTGDGAADSLFAHEISKLTLARTRVVVLAACSTAGGAVTRGEGVISVARPFLGAGVPVVVASQWDVDDASTHRLLFEFHRALSQRFDPAAALRTAQLKLLRSDDDALASPAAWGAFTALGTIAQ